MRQIQRLYHFLGGLKLAIILIVCAALFVMTGTFLEAYTESHLYASQWTYSHPAFSFLLFLFFINILFSALRRWPFKPRHIPFLITHLGLLMMIGGTILKNRLGVQGNMGILEGSGTHRIFLPHTFSLHVEQKRTENEGSIRYYDSPLNPKNFPSLVPAKFADLKTKVMGFTPHVTEKLETWIKGQRALISGFPALQVQDWKKKDSFILTRKVPLHHPQAEPWNILAIRTQELKEAIKDIYLQFGTVHFIFHDNFNPSIQKEVSLKEAVDQTMTFPEGKIHLTLDHHDSPLNGFENPSFQIEWSPTQGKPEKIRIPLNGPQALVPTLETTGMTLYPSLQANFHLPPLLLIAEDLQKDVHLMAFDAYGRIHSKSFYQNQLQSLVVYDQGFGGYAAQYIFPFPNFPTSLEVKRQAECEELIVQLKRVLESNPPLAPPLVLLKNACEAVKKDFASTLLQFLLSWEKDQPLLFSSENKLKPEFQEVFSNFNWDLISAQDKQACQWLCRLFNHLEQPIKEGQDMIQFLKEHRWPLLQDLQQTQKGLNDPSLLTTLAQQLFSLVNDLPHLPWEKSLLASDNAHLFSAYLKAYGMDYHSLRPPTQKEEESFDSIRQYFLMHPNDSVKKEDLENQHPLLETSLTLFHQAAAPPTKIEDHLPRIFLEITKGHLKQLVSLAYDRFGTGLKWPILNGEYTVRFQPQVIEIPYHIRLREARQINYANSNQPYSYESDVLIKDAAGNEVEKTLSMNQVHETWDGYRFYLSGMNSSTENGLKRVQIVVNYDPAKYYLTYPGALLISLGIISLFWLKPRFFKG